jgi:hypothetical protein
MSSPLHVATRTLVPLPLEGRFEIYHYIVECGRKDWEALSYTWGSSEPTSMVVFPDNTGISITANLESFLRHRRVQDKAVFLWIDALCTNQSDVLEKNAQVRNMSMIYVGAPLLIVWLGPAHNDSELAIEELKTLSARTPFEKITPMEPKILTAIDKLLTRDWWTRIWIIQELRYGVTVGKLAGAKIICGETRIKWMSLVLACARMKMSERHWHRSLPAVENVLRLNVLAQPNPLHEVFPLSQPYNEHMAQILKNVIIFRGFGGPQIQKIKFMP